MFRVASPLMASSVSTFDRGEQFRNAARRTSTMRTMAAARGEN